MNTHRADMAAATNVTDITSTIQDQSHDAAVSVFEGLSEDQKVLSLVTLHTKVLVWARSLARRESHDAGKYEMSSDRLTTYYERLPADTKMAEMETLLSQYVQLRMALEEKKEV